MTSNDLGPAPQTSPQARTFEVTPPHGQRLLAWCPQHRNVTPEDNLAKTTSWDLIGIDENAFPY